MLDSKGRFFVVGALPLVSAVPLAAHDNFVGVDFERAAHPASQREPGPGQCAWPLLP